MAAPASAERTLGHQQNTESDGSWRGGGTEVAPELQVVPEAWKLPSLLASRNEFGYSQLCNRWQQMALRSHVAINRLPCVKPCELGDASYLTAPAIDTQEQ
jgi:hypothetical protein